MNWLNRPQEYRFRVMHEFRNLMTRHCFERFKVRRRHQRKLWEVAKTYALIDMKLISK